MVVTGQIFSFALKSIATCAVINGVTYRVVKGGNFKDFKREVCSGFAFGYEAGAVIGTVKFIKASSTVKKSGSKTVDDLLKGLDETTNGKGVARNFESTGGYDRTLKEFDALNPSNIKDIQTKYGPGKVGTLSDGTKVVARQGSTTGGPTLEIKVLNSKVYKIRY